MELTWQEKYDRKMACSIERGIGWFLTLEQYRSLFIDGTDRCVLCKKLYQDHPGCLDQDRRSIDRTDPLGPYCLENCKVICVGCNKGKQCFEIELPKQISDQDRLTMILAWEKQRRGLFRKDQNKRRAMLRKANKQRKQKEVMYAANEASSIQDIEVGCGVQFG